MRGHPGRSRVARPRRRLSWVDDIVMQAVCRGEGLVAKAGMITDSGYGLWWAVSSALPQEQGQGQ